MIRLLLLGLLLLLAGGQTRSQAQVPSRSETPPAAGGATVMEVTTDSPAYCQTLSHQIETYRSLPREVRDLQREGRTLCSEGQVRGGINRLRRALMVMRSEPTFRSQ